MIRCLAYNLICLGMWVEDNLNEEDIVILHDNYITYYENGEEKYISTAEILKNYGY